MPRAARGELGDFVPSHFEDQLQGLLYILLKQKERASVTGGTRRAAATMQRQRGQREKPEPRPRRLWARSGRPAEHLLTDGHSPRGCPERCGPPGAVSHLPARVPPGARGLGFECGPRLRSARPPAGRAPFAGPGLPVGGAAPGPPRELEGGLEGARTLLPPSPRSPAQSRRGLAAPHSSPS